MKVTQYGSVKFEPDGKIGIEGWNVQREDTDPAEATNEQLLLELVINWARERLTAAVNVAVMGVYREAIQKKLQEDINKKLDAQSGNPGVN